MTDKFNDPIAAGRAAKEALDAEGRERAEAHARTWRGQEEIVQKYLRWFILDNQETIDRQQHLAEWIDERGQRRRSTGHGLPSGYPASALVKSNHRSLRPRLDKNREAIAVCYAMLERLRRSKQPLPETYVEKLDGLLAAVVSENENLMELVGSPKAKK